MCLEQAYWIFPLQGFVTFKDKIVNSLTIAVLVMFYSSIHHVTMAADGQALESPFYPISDLSHKHIFCLSPCHQSFRSL